jgi:hypothetical protein
VAKPILYLLLAFVAFDEPSNLPRLELGRLLVPETVQEEALTPVTELEPSRSQVHPANPPDLERRAPMAALGRTGRTSIRSATPSVQKNKGSAQLLTC